MTTTTTTAAATTEATTARRLVVLGDFRLSRQSENPAIDRACTRQAIFDALLELGVENPQVRSRNAKLRALMEAQKGMSTRLSEEIWRDLLGGMGVLIPRALHEGDEHLMEVR